MYRYKYKALIILIIFEYVIDVNVFSTYEKERKRDYFRRKKYDSSRGASVAAW